PAFWYVCFGFASFASGVPSPKDHVYLSGGVPPSTSALNATTSGACPSSGSASAHASRGAASSSAFPPAAVVVVTAPTAPTVVVADFPDRPLAKRRAHFTGRPTSLVDRLVAYYDEVSSRRLRIVPTVGTTVARLPRPRAAYVQRPDAIARDALATFAADARS